VIEDCGKGIEIYAYGGPRNIAPAGAHNNIVVTGNTISDTPAPQIRVTSTDGLKIADNLIVLPSDGRATADDAIKLENVRNSEIRNNTIRRSSR